ncbi:(2Fe-2S)-binding protein [Paenibacillus sp. MER 180]|uniref:2Fe-2S iron-sulfur cluster-binding protein n=1 Tax=Paenibacillus sp. MER 180 TaxID=2939570 RepID=UPI00203BEA58|nr:2Fe-2S iron-sulfur cluster-binding protein [Paenibacillus sp. MER 180]MCM3289752.1 (2Fe-2S)-binding protein [Paenibacillus sp. MER 180]
MVDILFIGKTKQASISVPVGTTLLDAAKESGVDWNYACTRGTCARCRCLIEDGREYVSEVTDAEWNRMEEEEFEQGYRLSCQVVAEADGFIRAVHKPYF